MNLDELRTVQSKERRKDSLQQLRDSFYRDVASFIQDLKATRDRRAQQVEDPFSDNEVRQLSDELETAEEVAEALYERRVGKVVKLASFAAADMPVDDEGMTGEERELFEDLVARIAQNKQTVLDVLSGTATADTAKGGSSATEPQHPAGAATDQERAAASHPTASQTENAESTPPTKGVLAEAMGAETSEPETGAATESAPDRDLPAGDSHDTHEPAPPTEAPPSKTELEPDTVLGTSTDGGTTEAASPARADTVSGPHTEPTVDHTPEPETTSPSQDAVETAEDSERTTVRITKNVGDIFCVDGREYTLRSEDVVTLPSANAEPLVDRDAAQELD